MKRSQLSKMKPVDSHCHIDFEKFDKDREEVLERCKGELEFIVNAGSNLETNRKALELEDKNKETVVSNLGLHPTYTESFDQIDEIKKLIREKSPTAVGEIGLDHHHVKQEETRQKQEKIFREMIQTAEELGKPVVVHSRDAERKSFEILNSSDLNQVMLHCFNGTPELAEEAARKGFKIGVTTQVLYSSRVQEIVDRISLENILLETDSPFLYRGKRNEPVNVHESAEKIAEIKQVPKSEVVQITTRNAKLFFGR